MRIGMPCHVPRRACLNVHTTRFAGSYVDLAPLERKECAGRRGPRVRVLGLTRGRRMAGWEHDSCVID